MNAIRHSDDPKRVLDAFWRGQIQSKEWLIEILTHYIPVKADPVRIDIHGGWVGVLASMLFQSHIPVKYICSVDIDSSCEATATMMNKIEEMDGRFRAITSDMCSVPVSGNVIINTSCEHITQEQYELWLSRIPNGSTIILQSNNYNIPEHVRTAQSLEEFKQQSNLKEMWSGSLKTQLYDRWMIIGKR
jgi:hypothetical protein